MKRYSRIKRIVNIINRAYKLGYKFTNDDLAKYNQEAYKILTDAEVEDAIDGKTKEALVANLLLIDDNNLEDEMYVLNDVEIDAEAHICENAEVEDYEGVDMYWGNIQSFTWSDGMGYEIQQCGEIIGSDDYNYNWRWYRKDNGEWEQERWLGGEDDGKIFLEKVCDSLGRVIQLYI